MPYWLESSDGSGYPAERFRGQIDLRSGHIYKDGKRYHAKYFAPLKGSITSQAFYDFQDEYGRLPTEKEWYLRARDIARKQGLIDI